VVSAILFVPSLGLLGAALSALFVSFVMLRSEEHTSELQSH